MAELIKKYPKIYCSTCDDARPFIADEMPADELNPRGACDLVCEVCRLVIATLHE